MFVKCTSVVSTQRGDDTDVEILHEGLLRYWPPQYDAMQSRWALLNTFADLERSARLRDWHGRPKSYLLRGDQLARVEKRTETRTTGDGVALSQSPAGGTRAKPKSVVGIVILNVQPAPDKPEGDNCTPGYSPCLPPASDYDCAGGSGNGPEYTGPSGSRDPTLTN
jgi:hypothetical protein